MNKNMIFYLDDMPKITSPLQYQDHNLNMIYSFIHKTIFTRFNGKFSSEVVDDLSINTHLKLKVRENRYGITADDIYKTLLFILKKITLYASYLSFLVGVKEYLRGNVSLNDIYLYQYDDVIEGIMYDNVSYLEVLSSIHFSPLKFREYSPIINEGFGEYSIHSIEKKKIILKNRYSDNYIYFLIEKDERKQLLNVRTTSGIVYTGLTSLTNSTINSTNAVKVESQLKFRLKINSRILTNQKRLDSFKELLVRKIYSNSRISNILKRRRMDLNKSILVDKEDLEGKRLFLLYADYYPNKIFVSDIVAILNEFNLETICVKKCFGDFLKSNLKLESMK